MFLKNQDIISPIIVLPANRTNTCSVLLLALEQFGLSIILPEVAGQMAIITRCLACMLGLNDGCVCPACSQAVVRLSPEPPRGLRALTLLPFLYLGREVELAKEASEGRGGSVSGLLL